MNATGRAPSEAGIGRYKRLIKSAWGFHSREGSGARWSNASRTESSLIMTCLLEAFDRLKVAAHVSI